MTMTWWELVRFLGFFGAGLAYCPSEARHQNRRLLFACEDGRLFGMGRYELACLWRRCPLSWKLVGEVGVASSGGVFV